MRKNIIGDISAAAAIASTASLIEARRRGMCRGGIRKSQPRYLRVALISPRLPSPTSWHVEVEVEVEVGGGDEDYQFLDSIKHNLFSFGLQYSW